MKKILLILIILSSTLAAYCETKTQDTWTPFRFCMTQGAWTFPESGNVKGLNFGFPASYTDVKCRKIYGLDISPITESRTEGMQLSISNYSERSEGAQFSIINIVERFYGFQLAILNESSKSDTFQLGLVNIAEDNSKSFQIGLINIIEDGPIPFLPLINFN